MLYLFYIFLGFLPSLIWLAFYLRKDKHPEPNSLVVKIFIWGMLLAPLAVVLEILLIWFLDPTANSLTVLDNEIEYSFLKIIIISAFIPALVEEYLKYSAVKHKAIKNPEFDEPIDVMLYCIITALGFAAVENLFIVFSSPLMSIGQALGTIFLRFLGATFLHALASGLAGYWLALSLLETRKRKRFIFCGLGIAILFHISYNYLVVLTAEFDSKISFFFIVMLLVLGAIIASDYFKKLKKNKSICE